MFQGFSFISNSNYNVMYINRMLLMSTLVLILLSNKAYTQVSHQYSGWIAVMNSTTINKRLSIAFDGQLRSGDQWKEVQTIIIRPGLSYRIKNNHITTLGYALVDHHRRINDIGGWGPEHRIWEQYIINQSFLLDQHFTSLQHRLRLEQRFISKTEVDNNHLKVTDYQFAQRLRYFVRSIFPLKQVNKFQKGIFISLQEEVMVNISNTSNVNGKFFDQNRAYSSIGYRLSPKVDFEIGYMYQYISGKGNSSTHNSILQMAAYTRF